MNPNVATLREAALGKLQAARNLLSADMTVSADNEAEFNRLMGDFHAIDEKVQAALGVTRQGTSQADLIHWYTGTPSQGPSQGQFIPGSRYQERGVAGGIHGVPHGGLGAYHHGVASWGQAFLDARMTSVGPTSGGFQAALLETGSTAVAVPLRTEPIADPRRARFVFELLREENAPNGMFSYLKQTVRELNADVVEPGAKKPVSLFKLVRVDDRTKVIAHVTEPIDRFVVEDAPLLRSFVDGELRLGCNLALDARVVDALLAAATPGSGTLNLDGIRTAITTLQLIEMMPTNIVANPTDWQALEVEAVATFAANDNMPAASEAMQQRLYSIPVTLSNGIDAGSALVGSFDDSAELYVTGGIRIDVSDAATREVGDEVLSGFQTNEVVFRGERRAEIAIGRPSGFVVVGEPGS